MADVAWDPAAFNSIDWYDGPAFELAETNHIRASDVSIAEPSLFRSAESQQSLIASHGRTTPVKTQPEDDSTLQNGTRSLKACTGRERKRKLQGWRFGVAVSACLALFVMALNLLALIVTHSKYGESNQGGIVTAFTGSCDRVERWTTACHMLTNGLSSILLGASNYTQQAISSPLRKEVDEAHRKGTWVDIGIASVRNIWGKISWQRTLVWWLLAVSSIPIHLMYNSAVFNSLSTNKYTTAVVNHDFLKGHNFSTQHVSYDMNTTYLRQVLSQFTTDSAYTNVSLFRKLTVPECIQQYGTDFVTGYGHVLLVTDTEGRSERNTVFWAERGGSFQALEHSYTWICTDTSEPDVYGIINCDIAGKLSSNYRWTVEGNLIDHCISEITSSYCKLQFSTTILTVVLLMNLTKACCMFWSLWRQTAPTLVTVGDAIASFLEDPDESTKGRCLMDRRDLCSGPFRWSNFGERMPITQALPRIYQEHVIPRRWASAASHRRRCVTTIIVLANIVVACLCLGAGVNALKPLLFGKSPFNMGFGKADSQALISGWRLPQAGAAGLTSAVLVANIPQAICSAVYLAINGLFTSMLLGREWSNYYGPIKKALRVTSPYGQQRSTYHLELPFKYSVPLLTTSAVLHFLISESIFIVRVDVFDDGQQVLKESGTQVGYSCLPILLVVLIGCLLLFTMMGIGCRKLSNPMPVAGSCSVIISAACHPPKDDVDAASKPVSWGSLSDNDIADIHHCSFSSHEVETLRPGRMYAGEARPRRHYNVRDDVDRL